MTELEKIGLVEKVKVGLGQGNILYVKNFISEDLKGKAFITGKNYSNGEAGSGEEKAKNEKICGKSPEPASVKSSKINIPVDFAGNGAVDFGGNETVNFTGHSDKEYINNKYNNNNPNPILSETEDKFYAYYLSRFKRNHEIDGIGLMDTDIKRANVFREGIREQIDYGYISDYDDSDIDTVDEIVELTVEMMLETEPKIRLSGKDFDADYVKSRLFKLRRKHVEYIIRCLKNTTTKIGNIKSYLKAAIFNSLITIGSYYRAEVNHDMYGVMT
ncbi:MAG: hypothetical protein IJT37_05740 [Lachnospiraceae bacterium]|nr:hypothetical protein [Lachnospiraceae bacterium]